jgi:hypothetical protein
MNFTHPLISAILIFMTPEERQLLEGVYKLSEENNVLLKSMRRSSRWQLGIKLLYWGVILVASVAAYYGLKVYLNTLIDSTVGGAGGGGSQQNTTPQSLLNELKTLQSQNQSAGQ